MASDLFLTGCSTEGDLAILAQSVLDQAALVRDELLAQSDLVDTTEIQSLIDQLNSTYNTLISPANSDDLSSQIGLLPADPTQADLEARLEPLGLVLIDGIIWALGKDSNIENFRKLFFAVGSNVSMFLQLVHSTDSLVVVQTSLAVQRLPMSQATWSLDEARTLLSNDAIEAVYVAGDGASYVVVPTFLSVNKSVAQTALELGIPETQIVTQVFWLTEVDTTSAHINRLTRLGLDTNEITAVLTDDSVLDVAPTAVEATRTSADQAVATALAQMQLLSSRFSATDAGTVTSLRSEIVTSIAADRDVILEVERQVRFQPILIARPADMDDFLSLNTQADLPYLFASRRTVTSIDFTIAREDLINKINQALAIPAGSNTVSSILSNQTTDSTLDVDVNQTNQALILNACAATNMQISGDLRYTDLQTSYQCLSSIVMRPTATTTSSTPVIGYASYDSPSSTIVQQANISLTLQIPSILNNVKALAAEAGAVVSAAVNVLVSMLTALQSAIDAVLKPLVSKVQAAQSQIESFISRHMSYFGTASIQSSVLNCALGLSLTPQLPILSDIEQLLEGIQKKLKNLIAQIANIVGNFLAKLLCLPINFLNNLLKSATSALPAICKTDTFQLPSALQTALLQLREGFQMQSTAYLQFNRNLLRLQASVTSLPAKVNTFKQDTACNQTPLNSQFMTAFSTSINPVLGTSPVASISNAIQGTQSSGSAAVSSLLPTRG